MVNRGNRRRPRGRRRGKGKSGDSSSPPGNRNGATGLLLDGGQIGRQRRKKRRRGSETHGGARARQGATSPAESGGGASTVRSRPPGDATVKVRGVLQIVNRNGLLRSAANDYNPSNQDPWVPEEVIREHGLETGLEIEGSGVPSPGSNQGPWLETIRLVNGKEPDAWRKRTPFKDLVAEAPTERICLEATSDEISTRVVDLITPIGKGQRCLIVAPPKAGKTVLLQKLAASITANHPEIHLIVLLVDERPEEVTDMRRTVRGEVVASSSDEMARNHVQVAEIVLERAKRLVECGADAVVLLDSITRLSRAYNTEQRSSGRVLSGGIDARTMEKPRRFFGAARKAESGGSLTVIGTALVDTGSRMDEVIFQEFKGTGNTEIVMDRNLFDRRIFPAIDISRSGTRREELLYTAEEYRKVTLLRRALAPLKPAEAMQLLVERLSRHRSNAEFLSSL